jgi:hypothetical protein
MFGGLPFMLGGNRCCGVNKDELIVRLDPEPNKRRCRDRTHAPRTSPVAACPASSPSTPRDSPEAC